VPQGSSLAALGAFPGMATEPASHLKLQQVGGVGVVVTVVAGVVVTVVPGVVVTVVHGDSGVVVTVVPGVVVTVVAGVVVTVVTTSQHCC